MKWWEPLELPLCSPCDSLLEICPYPSSSICYHLRMNWDRKIWFTPSQRKFYAITICFDSSKPRAKLIILDLWIIIRVLDAEAGAIDCVSGFQIHGWESYYQNNHILVEAEAEVEAVEAALNQLLPKHWSLWHENGAAFAGFVCRTNSCSCCSCCLCLVHECFWLKCPFYPEMGHISDLGQFRNT